MAAELRTALSNLEKREKVLKASEEKVCCFVVCYCMHVKSRESQLANFGHKADDRPFAENTFIVTSVFCM